MLTARGYTELPVGDVWRKPDGNLMKIVFLEEKLNVQRFQEILDRLSFTHFLIINRKSVTPKVYAMIKILQLKDHQIEMFNENELRINITKHKIMSSFRVVNPMTDPFLAKNYKLLPLMLTTDPVARFYFFQVDDVIEVRKNDDIYYRRVVSA